MYQQLVVMQVQLQIRVNLQKNKWIYLWVVSRLEQNRQPCLPDRSPLRHSVGSLPYPITVRKHIFISFEFIINNFILHYNISIFTFIKWRMNSSIYI